MPRRRRGSLCDVRARIEERTWWSRPGLEIRGGRLTVAGRDAEQLARTHGTPLYAYDLVRVEARDVASPAALEDPRTALGKVQHFMLRQLDAPAASQGEGL